MPNRKPDRLAITVSLPRALLARIEHFCRVAEILYGERPNISGGIERLCEDSLRTLAEPSPESVVAEKPSRRKGGY